MIKHPDHVTVAVSDLAASIKFFEVLGFEEVHDVVIKGEPFSTYMHIPDLKTDHVTMVLKHDGKEVKPHFEIQLLHFYQPNPQKDPNIHRLDKYGYNHLCFTVDNLDDEVKKLKSNGIKILSDVLDFNERKLVYFEGPDGIILELAEWT